MSSLIPKLNKRRSTVSQKSHTRKTRTAGSKNKSLKKRIAVQKSRKVNLTQTKKAVSVKSVKAKPAPRKTASKKNAAKPTVAKKTAAVRKGTPSKTVKSRKSAVAARGTRRPARSGPAPRIEQEPKRLPSPKAVAGIRAFEAALKTFNRHDFESAKTLFESILGQFGDQPDIVSPVRTYLAICEQKLAKSSSPGRGLEALYNQGVFEFNRGDTGQAITIFEKALKIEPRADHVLYSLAAAYAKAGVTSKALETLKRAIALRSVHRFHSRHDPDFSSLRNDPDFRSLSGLDMEFSQ